MPSSSGPHRHHARAIARGRGRRRCGRARCRRVPGLTARTRPARTRPEDQSSSAVLTQQLRPARRRCAVPGRSPARGSAAMPACFLRDGLDRLGKGAAELVDEAPYERGMSSGARGGAEGGSERRSGGRTGPGGKALATRFSRSRFVAATMRTSTLIGFELPSRSICRSRGRAAA